MSKKIINAWNCITSDMVDEDRKERRKVFEEGHKQGAVEELEKIKLKIINHEFKRITGNEFLPVSKRNIVKYIEKRLLELKK